MIASKNWLKRIVNITFSKTFKFHPCRFLSQNLYLSLSRFPNNKLSFWTDQARCGNISFILIVTKLFKLLNQNFFWNLPLTALGCYDKNVRLFTYLNRKLFSHELKLLNYDGLWENKKNPGWKSTLQLDKIDSLILIG